MSAGAPAPADTAEPEHDWSTFLFATIWLIFLAFPAAALLLSDEPVWTVVLGLVGLAVFAGLYACSWLRHVLVPRLGTLGNVVLWCLVLLVPLTLLVPASPWGPTNTASFFVALCAYRLPLRQGFLASLIIAALTVTSLLLLLPQDQWFWPLCGLVPSWFLILVSRIASERSELHERMVRELAVSRQREEIGRDVHDILGHSLTVITVKTQLARRLLETDSPRATAELDDILALSREALTDVRSTVGKLRELDLGVELVQARAALRAAGITPHLPSSVPPMDEKTRSAFAGILREAVTNVVRHSGATTCRVTLTASSLRVSDDGAGPRSGSAPHRTGWPAPGSPGGQDDGARGAGAHDAEGPGRLASADLQSDAPPSATGAADGENGSAIIEGNGIRGMRDRARSAGYHLTVNRHPQGGTTVEVRRP